MRPAEVLPESDGALHWIRGIKYEPHTPLKLAEAPEHADRLRLIIEEEGRSG